MKEENEIERYARAFGEIHERTRERHRQEAAAKLMAKRMNTRAIIILLLVLICIGGLPYWGIHSYGWYPFGGGLGLVVLFLVLIALGII